MKKVCVGISVLFLWLSVQAGISTSVAQSELERYIRNADLIKRGKTPKPSAEEIEKLLIAVRNPQRKLFRERLYQADILSAPDVILQEAEEEVEVQKKATGSTTDANSLDVWLGRIDEKLKAGLKSPKFIEKYKENYEQGVIKRLEDGIWAVVNNDQNYSQEFVQKNEQYIKQKINEFTSQIKDAFNPKDKEEVGVKEKDKLALFIDIEALFKDHQKELDEKNVTAAEALKLVPGYDKFLSLLNSVHNYFNYRKAAEDLKDNWEQRGCSAYENAYVAGMKVIKSLRDELDEILSEKNIIDKGGVSCQIYNKIIGIITNIVQWLEVRNQGGNVATGYYNILDRAYYCDATHKAEALKKHNEQMKEIQDLVKNNPCALEKQKGKSYLSYFNFWTARQDVTETMKHEKDFISKEEKPSNKNEPAQEEKKQDKEQNSEKKEQEQEDKNKAWTDYYKEIEGLFTSGSNIYRKLNKVSIDIVQKAKAPATLKDIHNKIITYIRRRSGFDKMDINWDKDSNSINSARAAYQAAMDLIDSLLSYADTINPGNNESESCMQYRDVMNIAGAVAAWITKGQYGTWSKNIIEFGYYGDSNDIKNEQQRFNAIKVLIKQKCTSGQCKLSGKWWASAW